MNNLIRKYDTGTDYQVYFMQSQTNRKFGIGNYNTKTNKMENLVWIINYNTALNEIRKRLKIFNGEKVIEEKKNQYTLDDFKKDGELKIKSGQSINDELFYYLKNKMQPRSFSKKCFQPGIVVGKSIDNEDLYYTFVLKDEWIYIGLCAGNETTPKELMTENKKNKYNMNKKTIKLTESDFKSLIKESVNNVISKIRLNEYLNPYDIVEFEHFDNDNFEPDYYDGFVVLDGTGANLGNFENSYDAMDYARELATKNKYGTYYVYGTENNEYDEHTLIYDTDEDFQ